MYWKTGIPDTVYVEGVNCSISRNLLIRVILDGVEHISVGKYYYHYGEFSHEIWDLTGYPAIYENKFIVAWAEIGDIPEEIFDMSTVSTPYNEYRLRSSSNRVEVEICGEWCNYEAMEDIQYTNLSRCIMGVEPVHYIFDEFFKIFKSMYGQTQGYAVMKFCVEKYFDINNPAHADYFEAMDIGEKNDL